MLVRPSGVLDFHNLGGVVAAVFASLIHREKPNIELGIVDDSNNGFAMQAQVQLEIVTLAVQHFGLDHIGFIDLGMALEVLHQSQGLLEIDSGNKDGRHPMMDHAIGNGDFFSTLAGFHVMDYDLAFGEQS